MKVNFIPGTHAEETRKLAHKHIASLVKLKLASERKAANQ